MGKILFCASTASHIMNFHLPYIAEFKKMGWEVHVMVNEWVDIEMADNIIVIPIKKKITSLHNIKNIMQCRRWLKKEKYDFISLHTTLAAAILRISIIGIKKKTRLFYTCHGYLFEDKKQLKNRIYLLIEKILVPMTDVLMVMNQEDYKIANKYKLYKDRLYYTNGMGINIEKFKVESDQAKNILKKKKGFLEDEILCVYAAEFSERKNQLFLIQAFAKVKEVSPKVKLLLAGDGILIEECKAEVKRMNLEDTVYFLGYVNNMCELYRMCDIAVSSSHSEGLPFNIMEAMACGLPVLASDVKGHQELVEEEENGILYKSNSLIDFIEKLKALCENRVLREKMGMESEKLSENYSQKTVVQENMEVYKMYL